ncbi:membrane protein [Pandoraea iniqua]|uniref:Membrane protein n=1 Tax=Pandoraea iniqua TaxID=2508288 RepID=A0A5E4ZCF2_9BURK|nr:GlsB/YeaQ/YmgE family stress response membrane protein [Pandoraea iniqua]VVE57609.1 membrane protein [Pandoraea iniqua]VVE58282.1 membrane protein [Pandoraea iniqua]
MSILTLLLVGLVAGWLAGLVVGGSFGLIGDIVVGVIGAFIGPWLLQHLGIAIGHGTLGRIITATIGAIVLLALLRLVRR